MDMDTDKESIRMLMVDDEPDFLDATARALSRRGFQVETASDGQQALALLGRGLFDVMVLDVKMPGIDGVEVFRQVRLLWPELPVIMLTGHGTIQQAFETSRAGLCEYLTKPCDVKDLAQAARRAVVATRSGAGSVEEPSGPIRLLLVDDEPELADSLCTAFSRRNMTVTVARDGVAVLRLLQEQVFDVAILDVKMPGMSGLDVLRRIKKLQPSTEVIMLTGHPSMATALECSEEGACDLLMKPQSVEALTQKVREAQARRRQRQDEQRQKIVQRILDEKPD